MCYILFSHFYYIGAELSCPALLGIIACVLWNSNTYSTAIHLSYKSSMLRLLLRRFVHSCEKEERQEEGTVNISGTLKILHKEMFRN